MSEYPPIPGVELGEHERITDHGTLLGYEWWVTLYRRENTEKFIADFLIQTPTPPPALTGSDCHETSSTVR